MTIHNAILVSIFIRRYTYYAFRSFPIVCIFFFFCVIKSESVVVS